MKKLLVIVGLSLLCAGSSQAGHRVASGVFACKSGISPRIMHGSLNFKRAGSTKTQEPKAESTDTLIDFELNRAEQNAKKLVTNSARFLAAVKLARASLSGDNEKHRELLDQAATLNETTLDILESIESVYFPRSS